MSSIGVVAGAVIARAGRVLLIRRATPAGALLWTFPSGKVDPGESASDAAAREAHEEAGVSVAPLVVLGSRVHPASGWRVVYVACRLLDGEAHAASPREVAEVAWVRSAELAGYVPGGVYPPVRAWLASHPPATGR
ncbi:NUDIX hydrolase [Streptomyces canus]|uniref:NUDIX hydrolase n=1 Tax=Streptomyces canus TaxID=58343 RepID=UPI0036C24ADA